MLTSRAIELINQTAHRLRPKNKYVLHQRKMSASCYLLLNINIFDRVHFMCDGSIDQKNS